MGSLLLEIGQAGNQIGLQLADYIDQTNQFYDESYMKRSDQNIIHSIMIDTEPKILKPIIENRKRYPFIDTKNIMYFQYGRGNNWALGYMDTAIQLKKKNEKNKIKPLQFNKFMEKPSQLLDLPTQINKNFLNAKITEQDIPSSQYLKENDEILENSINMIRKEIEKIDYFIGLNMIYSLGGGTGSGLGSRLLQEFRDIFQDVSLINTVIFPSKDGETTLQHYNCILSLAHLQTYSDCIIYFENDKINDYLNYSRSKSIDKSVDLTNLNQYIASNMMNLFRINDYATYDRFFFDLLLDTAPMEDFKFVELYSSPYLFDKQQSHGPEAGWEKVTDVLCQQVNVQRSYMTEKAKFEDEKTETDGMQEMLKENQRNRKNVSMTVNTVCRFGDIDRTLKRQEKVLKNIEKKMTNTFNPVKWNSDCLNFEFIDQKLKQGVDNKMMVSVANRSSIANVISEINQVAYNKYKANAFMHWYYKFGVEKGDFENAFLLMDNIVDNYNSLK